MKDECYTNILCKGFCRYYKAGKEDLKCGGYRFLFDNFTLRELEQLADQLSGPELKNIIPPDNEELMDLVCRKCDFRVDGCDYFEDRSGPPCGGFLLIYSLTDK